MTIQCARHGMAALLAPLPKAPSSFVRRLVAAVDDPPKRRIRAWLIEASIDTLVAGDTVERFQN
jgi:hypothetical protein